MEIKDDNLYIADTAGFCWGVKRAVDIAMDSANKKKKPIFTYGPLIHNPQTLIILKKLGINIISDIEDLPKSGTVIIRAHGISDYEKQLLCSSQLDIVDATCPKVKKIQKIIASNNKEAKKVYIFGDKEHSEVKGLLGYADNKGAVIDNENKDTCILEEPSILLCQTTADKEAWEEFCKNVSEKYNNVTVYNTICDATTKRQEELRMILRSVDLMIIIGGKNSANTRRLYNISKEYSAEAVHIENPNEIDKRIIKSSERIGITAGASTPAFVIQNTLELIQRIKNEKDNIFIKFLSYMINLFYLSDLYSSLGIAGLSFLFQKWLGLGSNLIPALTLFFFYWGLLLMNHLLSTQDRILNDYIKVDFYNRYLKPLVLLSILNISVSFILAYIYNIRSLPILGLILLLSYAYQRPVPKFTLKQIKASKDFVFSAALCILSSFIPVLYYNERIRIEFLFPFVFIFFIALIRSLIFDIRDMNRDKIFGKETLPILIGKEKTKAIIIVLSIVLFLILTYGIFTVNKRLYLLYIPICYIILCMYLYKKRYISKGIAFDIFIETIFVAVFLSSIFI